MKNPAVKTLRAALRPGDGLVLVLFFGLALGSFWAGDFFSARRSAGANLIARITVNQHDVAVKKLAEAATFDIAGAAGAMTLQIAHNSIRVQRSSCPNQICVKQGAATRPGEMLVCVPNRLVIFIQGFAPPLDRAPQESRGDAVTH